jgi:hypothetical protein
MALGQVFSEYFGFPSQFSFHHTYHLSSGAGSGAGTIGQLVVDVPSGLKSHPTPRNWIRIWKSSVCFPVSPTHSSSTPRLIIDTNMDIRVHSRLLSSPEAYDWSISCIAVPRVLLHLNNFLFNARTLHFRVIFTTMLGALHSHFWGLYASRKLGISSVCHCSQLLVK